ncbi:NAD(+) diphosphatase [Sphingobium aquiterrae]|uniref:NAD(+) diphosphatase n=1 Tax=Sphingobium aquiterrae TaxID=2038656 RepID=UPI0030199019
MTRAARPGFVGGTLDRADQVRSDPARLGYAFADARARLLLMDGLNPVTVDGLALAMTPLPADTRLEDHVLLGIDAQGPLFVALNDDIPNGATPTPELWQLASQLPPEELALFGGARSLVDWHKRHRFCANCGQPTQPHKAGWARRCEIETGGCGAEHFPRVDPVTIMLAEYGDRILVGRQHRWPQGRYSALAGFIEPGETVEEAVARELFEEAGIHVDRVDYVMSQPWPFPSSLMIACIAQATGDALTLDETEIEHAMWVDEAGVRAAMEGSPDAPFLAPPKLAVAWHLFAHWLDRRAEQRL